MQTGNLIIVSGPSGAGKSALVGRVLGSLSRTAFSISYTTRPPRRTERDGVEYFFIDRARFQDLIDSGDLLEHAEVHSNLYGTSKDFVDTLLRQGRDVILDIDVQGAQQIRKKRGDAVAVFVLPPSFAELQDRLHRRSLDDAGVIAARLKRACKEIRQYTHYDYLIVNEDLAVAAWELESIILGARSRIIARRNAATSILESFGGMDAENS